MTLFEDLAAIKTKLERTLEIVLNDEDFVGGREEVIHIFLHEACHAAISHAAPWIHDLAGEEHTAVDELMARFLEKEIGKSLGLFVHSTDEYIQELQRYPVDVTKDNYAYLNIIWESYFWPRKDLPGMATFVLAFLRFGEVIYHLLPKVDWETAQTAGVYKPANFVEDGFIHCSKVDQVVRVANAYYGDAKHLLMLTIPVEKVQAGLRWEDLLGEGELFPHIYEPLDLKAVAAVSKLEKNEKAQFSLPTGLSAVD